MNRHNSTDYSKLRVLAVDDEPISRKILLAMLSKTGADITPASGGVEALALFKELRHQIVITDISMPDMSGIELVSAIKSIDPSVKAIATSALSDPEHFTSAFTVGFNDYLLKPYRSEKLILSLKRASEMISVEQQLANEQEKFQTIINSLADGISIKDKDFNIVYQNRAMLEMFGDRFGEKCYLAFGHKSVCPECPALKALADDKPHLSCKLINYDGRDIYIESSASTMKDSRGEVIGTVEIVRDVSKREQNQEMIRKLAFHDPLTRLANRRLFEDRLEQAVAAAKRSDGSVGVIYLDLDNFKDINDNYGHDAGDKLLVEAAEKLKRCCKREIDTISRHGGDEFCIIIPECGGRENLELLTNQILKQFAEPVLLDEKMIKVGVSIGVAIYPDNAKQPKELQIAADRAMYAAKKAGRERCCFWEPVWER